MGSQRPSRPSDRGLDMGGMHGIRCLDLFCDRGAQGILLDPWPVGFHPRCFGRRGLVRADPQSEVASDPNDFFVCRGALDYGTIYAAAGKIDWQSNLEWLGFKLRVPFLSLSSQQRKAYPNPLSNCLIQHTCKMLIRLGVCVCYGETVREGFERTESNTESNCALFGPMPGERWHTQNEPEPRMTRASRK